MDSYIATKGMGTQLNATDTEELIKIVDDLAESNLEYMVNYLKEGAL